MINVTKGAVGMKGDSPEIILETCCVMASAYQKLVEEIGGEFALEVFADMGRFAVAEHNSSEQEAIGEQIVHKMCVSLAKRIKSDCDDENISSLLASLIDVIEEE